MRKIIQFLGLCLLLYGIGSYFYPVVMTDKLEKETVTYVKEVDQAYKQNKKKKTDPQKDPFFRSIQRYNQTIYENGQKDFKDAFSYTWFPIPLDGFKDERCGYIKIPAMDVELPLYVRATKENMAKGAAVLGNTSIPIGGNNTNAVIAAHRGYQGIPYFREIEKLGKGDKVIIKNKWQKLTYRVDSIKIIYPDESDEVKIQPGKDMLTLLTCHPYRSGGKYRYLVYCVRDKGSSKKTTQKKKKKTVETTKEISFVSSEADIKREDQLRAATFLFLCICVLYVLIKKISYRRKR